MNICKEMQMRSVESKSARTWEGHVQNIRVVGVPGNVLGY